MRALVYVRKSSDEPDTHADAKSVTRQTELARAAAVKHGWTVAAAEDVYGDDGISGALDETKRPGLRALLEAVKTKKFDIVITASADRLARDQWTAAAILSTLHAAGVRLFYYQEDRFADLSGSVGKFMEAVHSFGSEFYRESVTKHMVDALKRKARAGHVHGGKCFGYSNHRVDGHVDRVVNPAEARVVLSIFTMFNDGLGYRSIAHKLNADHVPCPRPSKGGPAGWSPITVRDVLQRPLYVGEIVSKWGDEVFRVQREDLRIVPRQLWSAVLSRRQHLGAVYLRNSKGRLWSKPANGIESKYLLTGMSLCPCGSPLTVRSRGHGKKRMFYYQCRAALDKAVCTNALRLPLAITDTAVLSHLEGVLLNPDVIAEAIRRLSEPDPSSEPIAVQRSRLQKEHVRIDHELANFANAIASGAKLDTITTAIKLRETRRTEIQSHLARLAEPAPVDLSALRPKILALLADWKGLASRHVQVTRQLLRKLLIGRLTFTPGDQGVIRFSGQGTLSPIIGLISAGSIMSGPNGIRTRVSALRGPAHS
jgi:site-specific DNA recombinase